jgi:hypothetical protein
MLDKYFKLLQNDKNQKTLFIESVFEVCKIENKFYKFEFIVNKEDLIKVKVVAASAIKFTILQNKEKIGDLFKQKLNKNDLIILVV